MQTYKSYLKFSILLAFFLVGCHPEDRRSGASIQDLFNFGPKAPIGPDALEKAELDYTCAQGLLGIAGFSINQTESEVIEFLAGGVTQQDIDDYTRIVHEWVAAEFVIETTGADYRILKKLLNRTVNMLKQELTYVPNFRIYIISPRNNLEYCQAFTTGRNIYFSQDLLKLLSNLDVSYPYAKEPAFEERVLSVLLHEIGHTIGEDYMSHIYRSKIFTNVLGDKAGLIGARIYSAIISPFEKEDEYKADLFSTWAMWQLDCSPYAVSAVWTAMEKYQNSSVIAGILSSHPTPSDRAQCMYTYIQKAQNKASKKQHLKI